MKALMIELKKEKRTGIAPLMLAVGILGAGYALLNFLIRGDVLLALPLSPMDILLTQLYGMVMVLNMFGIVVAACQIYHMEFQGNAVKKMHLLPMSIQAMYFCKFLILTILLLAALFLQNLALVCIGITKLPQGTFDRGMLLSFAGYSFVTSMPVLSFMLFTASRIENIWIPLGIGVAGFLSGMALATSDLGIFMIHPFVIMLKPAVTISAKPDPVVLLMSFAETILFLTAGLWASKRLSFE